MNAKWNAFKVEVEKPEYDHNFRVGSEDSRPTRMEKVEEGIVSQQEKKR